MNLVSTSRRRGASLLTVMSGALLWFAAFPLWAADPIITTSASKQFVVRGLPQRSALAAGARDDFAYLDPATLVVTCERVRESMARELGWGDRWRGIIYVNIRPTRGDGAQPDILPLRTDRGWSYRIDLPDEIARTRLLETIVEALLWEFANRGSTNEPVDLPPWLTEGLTAHLAQGPLAGLALQARSLDQLAAEPMLRAARDVRHADVDKWLRQRLQTGGALTFDQLSWMEIDEHDTPSLEAYHHSAHLFVRELLRLRGGPDALCATLAMLPDHLNWQTAFVRGFDPYFHSLLEVEKWWSLAQAQLKSHATTVLWSGAQARRNLEEILFTPMEVRVAEAELPHVTPVALQTVLNEWDFEQQTALLRKKMEQLQMARLRCTPDGAGLAGAYYATLANYLQARGKPGRWFAERKARAAVERAIRDLNTLDERLGRLAGHRVSDEPSAPGGPGRAKPLAAWSEPRPGVAAPGDRP